MAEQITSYVQFNYAPGVHADPDQRVMPVESWDVSSLEIPPNVYGFSFYTIQRIIFSELEKAEIDDPYIVGLIQGSSQKLLETSPTYILVADAADIVMRAQLEAGANGFGATVLDLNEGGYDGVARTCCGNLKGFGGSSGSDMVIITADTRQIVWLAPRQDSMALSSSPVDGHQEGGTSPDPAAQQQILDHAEVSNVYHLFTKLLEGNASTALWRKILSQFEIEHFADWCMWNEGNAQRFCDNENARAAITPAIVQDMMAAHEYRHIQHYLPIIARRIPDTITEDIVVLYGEKFSAGVGIRILPSIHDTFSLEEVARFPEAERMELSQRVTVPADNPARTFLSVAIWPGIRPTPRIMKAWQFTEADFTRINDETVNFRTIRPPIEEASRACGVLTGALGL